MFPTYSPRSQPVATYHIGHPKPGVRVCSVPRPKQHLSLSQAKAARTIPLDKDGKYIGPGVLHAKPDGRGVGLGMISTVRSCPSMLMPTTGPNSGRGPKSPKPRPVNLCCRRPLKTERMVNEEREQELFHRLRKLHARCVGFGMPKTKMVERLLIKGGQYAALRQLALAEFPLLAQSVANMEAAHKQTAHGLVH